MAQFLIFNKTNTHSDPVKNIESVYKRGDIIGVFPNSHVFGRLETLPDFVIASVSGISVAVAEKYINAWDSLFDFTILVTNTVMDGVRLRGFTLLSGSRHDITRAMVEGFLAEWNASFVSAAANEVVFDTTIENIYTSAGLWGVDPAANGIIINETSYNQQTGDHVVEIDATNATLPVADLKAILRKTATNISRTGKNLTVTFSRTTLKNYFLNQFKKAFIKIVRRRRYHIAPQDCDLIVNVGGVLAVSKAQFLNKILDKAI